MIVSSPQELALLSRTERIAFRIADFASRRLSLVAVAWNSTVLVFVTWLLIKRRLRIAGLDELRRIDPGGGVLMVANHRSFFDFFAVCCVLFNETAHHRRVRFPVRSTFFYDHWLGTVVNAAMSAMAMFPPILRDPGRRTWNTFAIRRCVDELCEHGVFLGVHPEGTRSTAADPYAIGPTRPGMGQVALEAEGAVILPIFLRGLSNSLATELRRNWRDPGAHPIDICFGAPVCVDDLRSDDASAARRARRKAIDRCMGAVAALADACRARNERAAAEAGAASPLAATRPADAMESGEHPVGAARARPDRG